MALNVGPRTENPWGAAFSGMMNMKMQQKQWNQFLDAFGPNRAGNQGGNAVNVSGSTQPNPMAVYGAPPEYGGGQQQMGNPMANANPLAPMGRAMQGMGQGMGNMLSGMGRGIGAMGRGLGGMLGMNRPQGDMPMGAMPPDVPGYPMMGQNATLTPQQLQMLMMRQRPRNPFAMGGY